MKRAGSKSPSERKASSVAWPGQGIGERIGPKHHTAHIGLARRMQDILFGPPSSRSPNTSLPPSLLASLVSAQSIKQEGARAENPIVLAPTSEGTKPRSAAPTWSRRKETRCCGLPQHENAEPGAGQDQQEVRTPSSRIAGRYRTPIHPGRPHAAGFRPHAKRRCGRASSPTAHPPKVNRLPSCGHCMAKCRGTGLRSLCGSGGRPAGR